ncbi:MAG: hypothetical protein AB203_03290 [Parcubacteria bacterium C7867-008]|nr:MAG: hypothetical protein AB203_03290 [Parcubacteria bacterium C7867-008]
MKSPSKRESWAYCIVGVFFLYGAYFNLGFDETSPVTLLFFVFIGIVFLIRGTKGLRG